MLLYFNCIFNVVRFGRLLNGSFLETFARKPIPFPWPRNWANGNALTFGDAYPSFNTGLRTSQM